MCDGFGNDTIFTPVFTGTRYKHHICAECGYEIKLDQSCYGGVSFPYGTEGFKYCPGCGKPVARFSDKAIFEEKLDYEPLRPFWQLHEEYERKAQWLYYVGIPEDQRQKVEKLIPFACNETGWIKIAYNTVASASRCHVDWRKLKKLIKEFGEGKL